MAQNWWDEEPVAGSAPVPARGGGLTIQTRGADPKQPLETTLLGQRVRQGEIDGINAATIAQAQRDKAIADAKKAQADAQISAAKSAESKGVDPIRALAEKRLGQDELIATLNDARREIASGILPSAGFGSSISRQFGGTSGTDLAGSLSTIGSAVTLARLGDLKAQSATGASGLGALSEKEAAFLRDSIAALDQNQSKPKLLESLAKIELHYRRLNALADGQNPDDPKVAQAYSIGAAQPKDNAAGGNPPIPGGPNGGAGGGLAPAGGPTGLTSEGKTVTDPALAGVNSRVAALIKSGASAGDIRGYLDSVQPGLGGKAENLEAWITYSNQNPSKPINVQLDRVFKPNGTLSQTLGDIGAGTIAGVSPGTYAIKAADALTLGNLDSLTSDPAIARAAMSGLDQMNPGSSLFGTVTGGALAAGGLEAGLGRLGVNGVKRMIGSDALFGAGYGAGSSDDDRLGGAVAGTVAGVGGGMFGRGVARTAGRALSGVTDAGKQYLNNSGIPMTVGQTLGGAAKTFEDRLAGFPIVGDAINARRMDGVQGFNSAAFKEAVQPISDIVPPIGQGAVGQIGESGIQSAQDATSAAYRSILDPQSFRADAPFAGEMMAAVRAGEQIPQIGDQFKSMVANRVGSLFDPAGNISGRGFQDAQRGLRQGAASAKNEIMGHEFGQAAGQAEDALRGLVDRQAPDVLPQFDRANDAYRNLSVLENAVNRSTNSGGVFTPAQLGMASRQNTIAFGGKKAAAAGDRPFFDLQRAGQDNLPSTIPDSGTAGRYAIPAALGIVGGGGGAYAADGEAGDKAATGLGAGLGMAALAAAPYSKTSQALLQKALLQERPDLVVNLGSFVRDRARLGGMFASPLAIQYTGSQ